MKEKTKTYNIGSEPGFHTPLGHPAAEGDAYDAPPPGTPIGPVSDPLGIANSRTNGPKELPSK